MEEGWGSDSVVEYLPSLIESLGFILALKTNKQTNKI